MKELLLKFTTDDEGSWTDEPLHVGEYDIATDRYSLIAVKQDNGYKTVEEANIIDPDSFRSYIFEMLDGEELYPRERITVQELRDCVEYSTTKGVEYPTEPCKHCKGDGTVEYTHDWNSKEYDIEGDCPACEGDGNIVIRDKAPKEVLHNVESKQLKIGTSTLYGNVLNKVLIAAEYLQQDSVLFIRGRTSKLPLRFLVGEAIVVCMPTSAPDYYDEPHCRQIISTPE